MIWIGLTLFYGLAKGAREICKKKALMKSSVIEVLFFYTLISFVVVIPEVRNAAGLTLKQFGLVFLKSFVIFVAWICSFKAIKKLPVSVIGVLDLSRILFATLMGMIFFSETVSVMGAVGLILVSAGLVMLPIPKAVALRRAQAANPKVSPIRERLNIGYVILALVNCILNAVSGTLDKYLMSGTDMTSGQLQFWYMLFLLIMYGLYILVKEVKIKKDGKEDLHMINWKNLVKNYWIYALAVLLVLADRALFIANADPNSKVTVMTLIKQSGCIITILGGKFIFKEKDILYKMICAAVIIAGIVIATVW